jgi:hypothetical protein
MFLREKVKVTKKKAKGKIVVEIRQQNDHVTCN